MKVGFPRRTCFKRSNCTLVSYKNVPRAKKHDLCFCAAVSKIDSRVIILDKEMPSAASEVHVHNEQWIRPNPYPFIPGHKIGNTYLIRPYQKTMKGNKMKWTFISPLVVGEVGEKATDISLGGRSSSHELISEINLCALCLILHFKEWNWWLLNALWVLIQSGGEKLSVGWLLKIN